MEQPNAIGLNSEKLLGLVLLGIGLIMLSFQILGISEVVSEMRKISVIQGLKENLHFFKTLKLTLSGDVFAFNSSSDSILLTVSVVMFMSLSGL